MLTAMETEIISINPICSISGPLIIKMDMYDNKVIIVMADM